MIQEYYSNGKLLISGEYVVLEGARAFALPTRYGQSMYVSETNTDCIHWVSYDVDGTKWMEEFVPKNVILEEEEVIGSAYYTTLVSVLRAAHKHNQTILNQEGIGFEVISKLSFPRLWGLGTSSTWINNVAQWFEINPYQLLQESFGGSGYDIACANYDQGLFYTLTDIHRPEVEFVSFNPSFAEHIYFVYLNQKKSSKEAIANFKAKRSQLTEAIKRISEISLAIATCQELNEFVELLEEHEKIMSRVLEVEPVKALLFSDFNGTIKSLGGWGGDFVMVVSVDDPEAYFKAKGYTVVINYKNMIL